MKRRTLNPEISPEIWLGKAEDVALYAGNSGCSEKTSCKHHPGVIDGIEQQEGGRVTRRARGLLGEKSEAPRV